MPQGDLLRYLMLEDILETSCLTRCLTVDRWIDNCSAASQLQARNLDPGGRGGYETWPS